MEAWMRPKPNMKQDIIDLVECLPINITMVEIGSYAGESTELFCSSNKIAKCYAVDPWQNGYDDTDNASYERPMEIVEKAFDERMKNFTNVIKMKMTSEDASKIIDSIDFVYIDGMHTYEAVKQDITLWKSKIRVGGFIGGHDFYRGEVRQAIHEELGFPDKHFCGTSWIKKIEPLMFTIRM